MGWNHCANILSGKDSYLEISDILYHYLDFLPGKLKYFFLNKNIYIYLCICCEDSDTPGTDCETFQDNNGSIELDEFLTMMANRMKANEKIREVFEVFDTNDDG